MTSKWLPSRSSVIRTAAPLLMLTALTAFVYPASAQEIPLVNVAAAPAFTGRTWASGTPKSLAPLKGKVVLVAFWTRGCINCKRTLPFWNDWAARYGKNNDFAVVSVHTPETPGERSPERVRQFAQEKNLRFPILIDNDAKNWDAWGIQAWPTTLLLDKQGRVRAKWEGELNWNNSADYKRVEQTIEKLRKEK